MREGLTESPLNPLPMAVWLLALPIIASEAVFGLGRIGLIGGAQGVGLRLAGMQLSAYAPEMVQRMWDMGAIDWAQIYRLFSYSFVNASFTFAWVYDRKFSSGCSRAPTSTANSVSLKAATPTADDLLCLCA